MMPFGGVVGVEGGGDGDGLQAELVGGVVGDVDVALDRRLAIGVGAGGQQEGHRHRPLGRLLGGAMQQPERLLLVPDHDPDHVARAGEVGDLAIGPTGDAGDAVAQALEPQPPADLVERRAASPAWIVWSTGRTTSTPNAVATGGPPRRIRHASRHAATSVSSTSP